MGKSKYLQLAFSQPNLIRLLPMAVFTGIALASASVSLVRARHEVAVPSTASSSPPRSAASALISAARPRTPPGFERAFMVIQLGIGSWLALALSLVAIVASLGLPCAFHRLCGIGHHGGHLAAAGGLAGADRLPGGARRLHPLHPAQGLHHQHLTCLFHRDQPVQLPPLVPEHPDRRCSPA